MKIEQVEGKDLSFILTLSNKKKFRDPLNRKTISLVNEKCTVIGSAAIIKETDEEIVFDILVNTWGIGLALTEKIKGARNHRLRIGITDDFLKGIPCLVCDV